MLVGANSDTGRIRQLNEDAFYVGDKLLVVADGMGGHAAGEVASQLAVRTVSSWSDWSQPLVALRAAFAAANKAVLVKAASDSNCAGMGTTLTACLIYNKQMMIAHIGDSRLYLMRQAALRCLTIDHSIVGEMVRSGGLSEEAARSHPQRNILTRALGAELNLDIDIFCEGLQVGDRLLLCTDGLHAMVQMPMIEHILFTYSSPKEAAAKLISAANDAGGADNITTIVADILKEDLV